MVQAFLFLCAVCVLAAAATIYWLGWLGVALVAAGMIILPWAGRLLGNWLMESWATGVANEIARPLENARATLETLVAAAIPSAEQVLDDEDDPEAFSDFEEANRDRDWYLLELTITPDENLQDKNGRPPQWDPELVLPFVPSGDGQNDLEDALLQLCEVMRWEVLHHGKWVAGRMGRGPTRLRLHVGIPRSARRLRLLFCLQTIFGELALPQPELEPATS